jgi:hypothetical protein
MELKIIFDIFPIISIVICLVIVFVKYIRDKSLSWVYLRNYFFLNLIAVMGIGSGIGHLIFAVRISRSLNYSTGFQKEIGYVNLAFGIGAIYGLNMIDKIGSIEITNYIRGLGIPYSIFLLLAGINHIYDSMTKPLERNVKIFTIYDLLFSIVFIVLMLKI